MNDNAVDALGELLKAQSIRCDRLDDHAVRNIQQQWREAFARTVKQSTGKWSYRGFDWHAFSYKFAESVHGEKAREAYLRASVTDFYVFQEGDSGSGYRCAGTTLPDPNSLSKMDVYVCPLDFSWTMAFTHEEPEIGPFFSERGQVNR